MGGGQLISFLQIYMVGVGGGGVQKLDLLGGGVGRKNEFIGDGGMKKNKNMGGGGAKKVPSSPPTWSKLE